MSGTRSSVTSVANLRRVSTAFAPSGTSRCVCSLTPTLGRATPAVA